MTDTGSPNEPDDTRKGPGAAVSKVLHETLYSITHGGTVVVTFLAFVLALVFGAVLIVLSDSSVTDQYSYFFAAPGDAISASWDAIWNAYSAMFKGAIIDWSTISTGDYRQIFAPLSETIVAGTPLIFAGLSVTLAFRAGLFNIGAEGQTIAGAIVAGWIGFAWNLPVFLHVVVAVLGGFVGGAVWGGIVGVLKARTGAHEVITTIMLNNIATFLLLYLLKTSAFQRPGQNNTVSKTIDGSAKLPHLLGPDLRIHAGFLVALFAAAAVAWLLNRSTPGFEFRAVGANQDAARTAGMSVGRITVLAMLLTGALSGLAGANQVLGVAGALTPGISGGLGFDAITVSLLGRATPWGTVLAGLLFGALRAGGVRMQAQTGTSIEIVTVLQSLIVLFIAAPPLVKSIFRLKAAKAATTGTEMAKGWNG